MTRNILIIVEAGARAGRAQLIGILRRINASRLDWRLRIVASRREMNAALLGRTDIDGVVSAVPGGRGVPERLVRSALPVVFMDVQRPDIPFDSSRKIFISADDTAIAEAAARHFFELGNFRSFAYVHDPRGEVWSSARADAFAAALAKRNRACAVFAGPDNAQESRRRLAEGLAALPAPVAVFAACDAVAAEVAGACGERGLAVPDTVAVLGVDNDEHVCLRCRPALSSIEPDFEEEGFRAAGELARLLGEDVSADPGTPASVHMAGRASTHATPPATQLVERARAFIEANYRRPVGVRDVVRHLGVSRRLADLRFRQLEKESILEALVRRRLELLKAELRACDKPVKQLVAEAGFGSVARATHLFRARVGMSMTAYRRRSTSASAADAK